MIVTLTEAEVCQRDRIAEARREAEPERYASRIQDWIWCQQVGGEIAVAQLLGTRLDELTAKERGWFTEVPNSEKIPIIVRTVPGPSYGFHLGSNDSKEFPARGIGVLATAMEPGRATVYEITGCCAFAWFAKNAHEAISAGDGSKRLMVPRKVWDAECRPINDLIQRIPSAIARWVTLRDWSDITEPFQLTPVLGVLDPKLFFLRFVEECRNYPNVPRNLVGALDMELKALFKWARERGLA